MRVGRKRIIQIVAAVLLSVTISYAKCEIVVAGLRDIAGHAMPGSPKDLIITEHLCVGLSSGGSYMLEAHGDGTNGGFEISNSAHSLSYRLYYRDRSSGFIELQPNIFITGIAGKALGKNDACRGNASQVQVQIDRKQINNAPSGVYQGTVILTVAPE